jgi:hypothetical protein
VGNRPAYVNGAVANGVPTATAVTAATVTAATVTVLCECITGRHEQTSDAKQRRRP